MTANEDETGINPKVKFGLGSTAAGCGGRSGAIFGVIIGSGYYAAIMIETEKVIKKCDQMSLSF